MIPFGNLFYYRVPPTLYFSYPLQEFYYLPSNSNPTGVMNMPNTKVGLISLGCAKNLVDSENLLGMLVNLGM